MLFSDGVKEGKRLIQKAIDNKEIPQSRVEESVKKILLTKYYLGLTKYDPINPSNIKNDLNNQSHKDIVRNLYSHALTMLKNDNALLPINCSEKHYFVPLEEAPYQYFADQLNLNTTVIVKKPSEISSIPANSKVIVGLHKDNSTAYKPYKISAESKKVLSELAKNQKVILTVFGSAYALKDVDISKVSTVLVAYENNEDSHFAVANSLVGKNDINGRLPVLVNSQLKAGMGIDLKAVKTADKTLTTKISR